MAKNFNAFIAMPFNPEFDSVFAVIKEACGEAEIDYSRLDSSVQPGAIIDQIRDGIKNADIVIAEITSGNPNVYYEIGLAHCIQKPTVLVARADSIHAIPFDIRHNRVLIYNTEKFSALKVDLRKALIEITRLVEDGTATLSIDDYLNLGRSGPQQNSKTDLTTYVRKIEKQFDLTAAEIVQTKLLEGQGYVVSVRDAFGESVTFMIDVNGFIQKARRTPAAAGAGA